MWSTRQENQEKYADLLSAGVTFQLFEEKMVQMKWTNKACNFYMNKMAISRNPCFILGQICYIFLLLHLSYFSQNLFNKVALKGSVYH